MSSSTSESNAVRAYYIPSTIQKRIAVCGSLLFMALYMIWKIRSAVVHPLLAYSSQIASMPAIVATADAPHVRRRLQQRPVIYTFYEPLKRASATKREERIRQADQELLGIWKTAWSNVGWDPRIITLEDAKKHPLFGDFKQQLEKIAIMGSGGRNEEYNEYCFIRFIAMVSVGGGVMADYDLFPLQKATSLPSPDTFTIYQKTLNKAGPVPSLCSGSAAEWERIAKAILDISVATEKEGGWSDMVALMHLYKTSGEDILQLKDQVVGRNEVAQIGGAKEKCHFVQKKQAWGIHFSHYDVLQMGYKALERPQLVLEFGAEWSELCHTI